MHPQPLIAVPEDVEVWKNQSSARIGVRKYNQQGLMDRVLVRSGQSVHLTPRERRINQEMVAHDTMDPFKNGMFSPVRLLDSEEDTEILQANPNAMSETAMKALFRSQIKTFTARIEEISNPITLQRLQSLAQEADASLKQLDVITARLEEVAPSIPEVAPAIVGKQFSSGMKAVAPV